MGKSEFKKKKVTSLHFHKIKTKDENFASDDSQQLYDPEGGGWWTNASLSARCCP